MSLRAQVLFGYVLVFVLMVIIAMVMYRGVGSLMETSQWVTHTHEVISNAHKIEKLMVDMETGERGFLIAGEDEFLEPYEAGKLEYEQTMAGLKELVSDNPPQVRRLEAIERLVTRWHRVAADVEIAERRKIRKGGETESSMAKIAALIRARTGKSIIDDLRVRLTEFIEVEEQLLVVRDREASRAVNASIAIVFGGTALGIVLGLIAMFRSTRTVLRQVGGEPALIAGVTERVAEGDLDIDIPGAADTSTGILASVRTMLEALKRNRDEAQTQDWLKTGIVRLNEAMRGDMDAATLASKVISEMTTYVGAQVGAVYYVTEEGSEQPVLRLGGGFAYKKPLDLPAQIAFGEGLVGQAAVEKRQMLVRDVPQDYVKVSSALGEGTPMSILVSPFLHEDRVKGVIEIGSLHEITEAQQQYVSEAMTGIAVSVQGVESSGLRLSLEESQRLGAELQAQQEQLRMANEELEEQTLRLQESEGRLQAQQEELRVTNDELREKNQLLERQKRDVEGARREIAEQANELALASKYKSQFLANMSHELRTPLNSLLLLARSLADNGKGNLDADQVESATVIHQSGHDLLSLINEILDLSKIEAGRMELRMGDVATGDLAVSMRAAFTHLATDKGLTFDVVVAEGAPDRIRSDQKRVEQVLKNLISNALKFTHKGGVKVVFSAAGSDVRLRRDDLDPSQVLAITVEDSGIGITPDKQKLIFEAFQQADGTTARRYGGTGLGLSISRELMQLLGGEIRLSSEEGEGSTFTVFLPPTPPMVAEQPRSSPDERHPVDDHVLANVRSIPDDRESIEEGDRCILLIEDDPKFATLLANECRKRGFKCLAAATGEEGLELASRHVPQGIILDLRLPGMDGWAVLNALKESTDTRHVPVHIISVEEASTQAQRKGAVGHAIKPVEPRDIEDAFRKLEQVAAGKPKRVLVVEDDPTIRRSTVALVGNGDVTVDEASTGEEALVAMRSTKYDCLILDLGLPDMDGTELLAKIEGEGRAVPPVIIHTARDLTWEEGLDLRPFSDSIIIKDVRSKERLLDEVSLFLHRVVAEMPERKRQLITSLHDSDALLRGKKVLVVDDDMRALFALSNLLADRGMEVRKAENGEKAIEAMELEPDVDVVLMDIMMPVLDGYETMERIRSQERFKTLPIIALTAKAMKGDQERCIAAGASDYLPKPVDQDRLLSMLRVWLYR